MRTLNIFNPQPAWGRALRITLLYALLFLVLFHLSRVLGRISLGSLWYPAAGVRLALFLLLGWRLVPCIALAEGVVIALYSLAIPGTAYTSLPSLLPTIMMPIFYGLVAVLAQRLRLLDPGLRRPADLVKLVALALLAPAGVASMTNLMSYWLGLLPIDHLPTAILAFSVGDAIGILMITPFLLLTFGRQLPLALGLPEMIELPERLPWWNLFLDAFAVWATLAVLQSLSSWTAVSPHQVYWYFIFIPMSIAAFHSGLPGAIAAVLALTSGSAWTISISVDFLTFQEVQILTIFLAVSSLLMGAFISAHRTAERQLQAGNAILRETRAELELKNVELEARNADLERFFYTVSHDLKAPLFTIEGFLGHLDHDAETGKIEQVHRSSERIRAAIGTLRGLLNGLLDTARAGRRIQAPEQVDLSEVCQQAIDALQGRILETEAKVIVTSKLPTALGDRVRLLQIFQNLLDNALKFTKPKEPPRVEVDCEKIGGETVICVRDHGAGIATADLETIFGLFEKLDDNAEGTGIGLALVKRIVEEHGGRIWVSSKGPEQGSVFRFTLGEPRRA